MEDKVRTVDTAVCVIIAVGTRAEIRWISIYAYLPIHVLPTMYVCILPHKVVRTSETEINRIDV